LKHKTFQKLAVLVTLGKTKIQLVWNILSPRREAIFGFLCCSGSKATIQNILFLVGNCW